MRLNFVSKFLGDFTINTVRDLKIRDDFDKIYYECSKPLFSSNDFGLLDYDYQFWYNRALQFGEDVKKTHPHSEAIKKIDKTIEKMAILDTANGIINNLLSLILIASGLVGFGLFFIFGFKLSDIIGILISFATCLALVIFCVALLLRLLKHTLIFRSDLWKTITRRLIITQNQLEKKYTTPEKIFVANIWNNSLKSKASLSVLFFFALFKKFFPSLYEILIFSSVLILPICVPNYIKNQNRLELELNMSHEFKTHFGIILEKIRENFGERINKFMICVTIITTILLIISLIAYPNWILIVIEILIIIFGLNDYRVTHK